MQPTLRTPECTRQDVETFTAELIRLHREVSEISRQLDRIEDEMRQALHEIAWERFAEYH